LDDKLSTAESKAYIKKTIFLSFGFFASTLAWSVYNAFVPQILAGYIKSTAVIGLIMTIDNVFGTIFQPLFGRMSDKTHTRLGRRMPYLIIGIPVCAAAFVFIPHMDSIWSLMAVLIIFTFVMSFWRSPAVSLLPDMVPDNFRSQAGGFLDLMGGIGGVLAFAGGGFLFRLGGFPLPFLMSAIVMILALILMLIFVREPKAAYAHSENEKAPRAKLPKGKRTNLLFLLFAVFFWFASANAVETFFTLFATNTLGIDPGSATLTLAIFPVAYIVFAVPAGFIGAKFGRRRIILFGLAGMLLIFIGMTLHSDVWITRILLFVCGLFWACVNINALPSVVSFTGEESIGTFVGYYYLFSFSAQVVSPTLFGLIRDLAGHYNVLFVYASAPLAAAIVCVALMKKEKRAEVEAA